MKKPSKKPVVKFASKAEERRVNAARIAKARAKTPATAPIILASAPPKMHHRDYRIVFNDTMEREKVREGRQGWWIQHRDVFEDLSAKEHPIAALMRALGLYETNHHNRYATLLAHDYVLGRCWLTMWFEVRRLLNGDLGGMDGGLLDTMLWALAKNAGFEDKELR